MTDTSRKKTEKKTPRKRKLYKTTLKQKFFYLTTIIGSVFFLLGGIIVFYSHNCDYFLSKIFEYHAMNLSKVHIHFSKVHLNLWDLSIHIQNFRIDNPPDFPDEPAIYTDYMQTKFYISQNFEIISKIYINNLQLNLYHLPGKGTNIGTLSKVLKKEEQQFKKTIFENINSIYTDKIEIVISQNLEPQKIKIDTPQNIINNSTFPDNKNILEYIIDAFLINNKNIPEDFRTSLTKDMKHNTI